MDRVCSCFASRNCHSSRRGWKGAFFDSRLVVEEQQVDQASKEGLAGLSDAPDALLVEIVDHPCFKHQLFWGSRKVV